MGMASPVFHSSSSAAHPTPSSHSQSFQLQLELLVGSSSLDTHPSRSANIKHHYIHRLNGYNHTLTSSGLNWAKANTSPMPRPAVNMLGKDSKMSVNVVTPFSVGGGCLSENGAFGAKP